MNSLLRILCGILLLGLVSCATDEKILINPQSLTLCNLKCSERLESCMQQCNNNCPACSTKSSLTSTSDYVKYIHEKQVTGGYVARGLNSYRDPLQCTKVSCNCMADFNACKQNCTGVIQKRLDPKQKCI